MCFFMPGFPLRGGAGAAPTSGVTLCTGSSLAGVAPTAASTAHGAGGGFGSRPVPPPHPSPLRTERPSQCLGPGTWGLAPAPAESDLQGLSDQRHRTGQRPQEPPAH